ncbi:MAG TPA: FkbM family methyltransferase [Bryobacteraceae bacterium]|jgi:hypothetical protein|nr:FkbM family methyltransferase [Bryobacteraceae bacterium]
MKHFRDLLPLASLPGYFMWHFRQNKPFLCRLRNGLELSIRPHPSRDYDTVFEIFFAGIYACEIARDKVQRIVDLGGNVGYSCLYWCLEYPEAEVITFEPHPLHCDLLQWHIDENMLSSRVRLFRAAAGTCEGKVNLSNADTASSIISQDDGDSITVPLLDLFQT